MSPSIMDIISTAKEVVSFFNLKSGEKMPEGKFFRAIEGRYNIKLSKSNKLEILENLKRQGVIHKLESNRGKTYVVIGGLDF